MVTGLGSPNARLLVIDLINYQPSDTAASAAQPTSSASTSVRPPASGTIFSVSNAIVMGHGHSAAAVSVSNPDTHEIASLSFSKTPVAKTNVASAEPRPTTKDSSVDPAGINQSTAEVSLQNIISHYVASVPQAKMDLPQRQYAFSNPVFAIGEEDSSEANATKAAYFVDLSDPDVAIDSVTTDPAFDSVPMAAFR